jgi:hypothetical protein
MTDENIACLIMFMRLDESSVFMILNAYAIIHITIGHWIGAKRSDSGKERPAAMKLKRTAFTFLITFLLVCAPLIGECMTAEEILLRTVTENFAEAFRIPMQIKTFKGKKTTSSHVMWLMGRTGEKSAEIVVDFEEPKESKGLRFLFVMKPNQESKAYMYVPATKKTLPLAMDDPSVDIGGAGLTMEDVQAFIPAGDDQASLLKEEKLDGRDMYVIAVKLPAGRGERHMWISKKGFIVFKSQNLDAHGKAKRIFKVTELFKTEQGKEFPREEEITIPDKHTVVKLRQEGAVFGIELPDELLNPETFGSFQWRN